ncbi:ABC transporter permease [Apibacter raozihei]|uniref:ABC transporter permease n=1 Tax=Apibacter raozihei TaxID=2500547 RepID=UPI000FE2A7E9|nr:ABC transporter permease [Apibacter raozihei]
MRKLVASVIKELLLLIRDWGGLAVLFIMPSILIVIVTLIQNSTFKAVGEAKMPIILVDNDKGDIAKIIERDLKSSSFFEIVSSDNGKMLTEHQARTWVSEGKFQIAIIVPAGLSKQINTRVEENVDKILEQFTGEESNQENTEVENQQKWKPQEIVIYFDPAAGQTFRNSVKNTIDKMVAEIESSKVYEIFQEKMDINVAQELSNNSLLSFKEIIAQQGKDAVIPNAVQHNVPAWSLFGIFFIIIPLASNIVKEKNSGTFIRLRTSPVSYTLILTGKIITYSLICLLQFSLMLLIGIFIFPYLGLIPFDTGNRLIEMFIIALCSGLSAIGLGILIGTIARTQEQTAPFAAILVIILAALGGVWVPTFIMPEFMQKISVLTPMNWGLSSFYDIILRNSSLLQVYPNLLFLLSFFILILWLSVFYNNKRNSI